MGVADGQVIDDRAHHDRYRSGAGRGPGTLLGAPLHDPVTRGEAERGPTSQHDGVQMRDQSLGG